MLKKIEKYEDYKPFKVPRISTSWALYLTNYYYIVLKNLIRPLNLKFDKKEIKYSALYFLSNQFSSMWCNMLDTRLKEYNYSFTYFTSASTFALMKICDDLGINFRHILHFNNHMQAIKGDGTIDQRIMYEILFEVKDIVPVSKSSFVLVVSTKIYDNYFDLVKIVEDAMYVRNVPEKEMKKIKENHYPRTKDANKYQILKNKKSSLCDKDCTVYTLHISPDLGVKYGRISGDMNIIHTTNMAAKIFGYKKAFIQGLCSTNILLKYISEHFYKPIKSATSNYCLPVFVDSNVKILLSEDLAEILDENDNLLMFIEFELE